MDAFFATPPMPHMDAFAMPPMPPWLDTWNTSRIYPSYCVLACWRNESGTPRAPLGEVKGHGCNTKLERCPCDELSASRRAQTVTLLPLTHVVVLAARFTRSSMASNMVRKQAHSVRRFLPSNRSAMIIVDNASPHAVAVELKGTCERLDDAAHCIYARNGDWERGFGYELGAFRWALRETIPTVLSSRLAPNAILYFMQDSLTLAHDALPYPPPSWFAGAPLISYRTEGHGHPITLIGVPRDQSAGIEVEVTRAALATVRNAPVVSTSPSDGPLVRYMSNFGPNLVTTWSSAHWLLQRGFFDMLRVRTKFDEQVSERVIGYFFTHDQELHHAACSLAGDVSSHLSRCAARRGCNLGLFDKVFGGRADDAPSAGAVSTGT